jgi:hypothetical protein
MRAAKCGGRSGISLASSQADVANAMSSTPDGFGPWFAEQSGRLPPDFELDI